MLALYVVALVAGGILVGVGALSGGDAGESDGDLHGDVDHGDLDHGGLDHGDVGHGDVDHGDVGHGAGLGDGALTVSGHGDAVHVEGPAGAGPWLPFLSMRFWTFGLASFGLSGLLLTLLGQATLIAAPVSAVIGAGVGGVVAAAFRRLQSSNVGTETTLGKLRGGEAKALLPIEAHQTGKIRALLGGSTVDLLARTHDTAPIRANDTVLIVSIEEGVAEVTALRNNLTAAP